MDRAEMLLLLQGLVLLFEGVKCAPPSWLINEGQLTGAGWGIVWAIIAVICGIISLVTFLVCHFFGDKVKVGPKPKPGAVSRGAPEWTQHLEVQAPLNGGFTQHSEGLRLVSPFHLVRDRQGTSIFDGARWSCGFTTGKHVFEVFWPKAGNRGIVSKIGVASTNAELSVKKAPYKSCMLASHSEAWCLEVSSKKTIHFNKNMGRPSKIMPDRFYMYVDMDGGQIGFGDDVKVYGKNAEFFGYPITKISTKPDQPLHVMICASVPQEEIMVFYRGSACASGGFDLCPDTSPSVNKEGNLSSNATSAPIPDSAVPEGPVPQPPVYKSPEAPSEKALYSRA